MKVINVYKKWLFLACLIISVSNAFSYNPVYIPDPTDAEDYGTWDEATETFTLNGDFPEDVIFPSNWPSCTFDGGNHSVKGLCLISCEGVTVKNVNIIGIVEDDSDNWGLYLIACNNTTVDGVTIGGLGTPDDFEGRSIIIHLSTNDTIKNCTTRFGYIEIYDAQNTQILNNDIKNPGQETSLGVRLYSSTDITVADNSIEGFLRGISMEYDGSATFYNNTIAGNNTGFYVDPSHTGSADVYNNNFIENETNIESHSQGQTYHNNYFSNWTEDEDGDGFAEEYIINSNLGLSDPQPYVTPNAWLNQAPTANAGEDLSIHAGEPISLNGSGTDPENDELTYSWTILTRPDGSVAELTDADQPSAVFVPDKNGEYTIQLVVTDAKGADSEPDVAVLTSTNSAPVANAGDDIAITSTGTPVQLNGANSSDPDDDDINFSWAFVATPEGSAVQLDDPQVVDPSFTPDVYGDYTLGLTVCDEWGGCSGLDEVLVSFENIAPVANAGGNHNVLIYDAALLDGSLSSDQNGDDLTYAWEIVSVPEGSLAEIIDADQALASLTPTAEGEYIISLTVNDGELSSEADIISVLATSYEDALSAQLQEVAASIKELPKSAFKHRQAKRIMTRMVNVSHRMADRERFRLAKSLLTCTILRRTDGCATSGAPQRNDWIRSCEDQEQVYINVLEAISLLDQLMQ